ncbi:uncharacterized protein BP01DRAFT_89760 [Aspergillus saccharolyticus JOP 1030-1]|uniref:Uncharacterized protein n=1 Tax=Aspergillus saccharolyticus JOP 1030-1 TaxID=1450539 RepID=A0A318ZK56_9EURO|nr:hypothetical protein BP01DRAFT_89760 [Aspergillus saccharolyticus JOP 1030-1]PYH44160.1 hypothetical protein BP01DRAFT_89760 [Aspergillus saccharolyticus JOP 1030-1]
MAALHDQSIYSAFNTISRVRTSDRFAQWLIMIAPDSISPSPQPAKISSTEFNPSPNSCASHSYSGGANQGDKAPIPTKRSPRFHSDQLPPWSERHARDFWFKP